MVRIHSEFLHGRADFIAYWNIRQNGRFNHRKNTRLGSVLRYSCRKCNALVGHAQGLSVIVSRPNEVLTHLSARLGLLSRILFLLVVNLLCSDELGLFGFQEKTAIEKT